jgi:hypothetical protein
MTRPSTSFLPPIKDVDARHKAGHDGSIQPPLRRRVAVPVEWLIMGRDHHALAGEIVDATGRELQPQYRATIMIATTMNVATSDRTRSSIFDPGFAMSSSGGMIYVGGRNSPTSQPTPPDFIGSDAIATCST